MFVVQMAAAGVGIVGGLFGMVAFIRGEQDRKERRAKAHIPPEVRPLLQQVINVSTQIEKRAKSPEWIAENLLPLRLQWEGIAHPIVAAHRGDGRVFAFVSYGLANLCLCLDDQGRRRQSETWVSESLENQHSEARELTDNATYLLHWITTGERLPQPTADGSDMRPRSPRRWNRRSRLP